jgi:hypothetical protein
MSFSRKAVVVPESASGRMTSFDATVSVSRPLDAGVLAESADIRNSISGDQEHHGRSFFCVGSFQNHIENPITRVLHTVQCKASSSR